MTEEEVTHALSLLTPPIAYRQSRLDDLKYALASAGYSAEQIEEAEQAVINGANVAGVSIERFAHDALAAFSAMHSFQQSMNALKEMMPVIAQAMAETSQAIMRLAEGTLEPAPTSTERTPYYHKRKQKWWK